MLLISFTVKNPLSWLFSILYCVATTASDDKVLIRAAYWILIVLQPYTAYHPAPWLAAPRTSIDLTSPVCLAYPLAFISHPDSGCSCFRPQPSLAQWHTICRWHSQLIVQPHTWCQESLEHNFFCIIRHQLMTWCRPWMQFLCHVEYLCGDNSIHKLCSSGISITLAFKTELVFSFHLYSTKDRLNREEEHFASTDSSWIKLVGRYMSCFPASAIMLIFFTSLPKN